MRLIITDNKVMADAIAQCFGYDPIDAGRTAYDGSDDEILWTGGALVDLTLKVPEVIEETDLHVSAEEFTNKYFHASQRKFSGRICELDMKRLEYIENALGYCNEIIFICQPTDEGQRLIQALKLFFKFKIPTCTMTVSDFSTLRGRIWEEQESSFHTPLRDYLSAQAMHRVFYYEVRRKNVINVNTEGISLKAYHLLTLIRREMAYSEWLSHTDKRKSAIGGIQDFNQLFAAMATKYDMNIYSLWDSLLFLYAKGYINNPIAQQTCHSQLDILLGEGLPTASESPLNCLYSIRCSNGIVPTGPVVEGLLNLDYDFENRPDDFTTRTSAIYTHIIETNSKIIAGEEAEIVEYPSYNEMKGLPITTILNEIFICKDYLQTDGVCDSFGALIYELEVADLIHCNKGFVTLTDSGLEFVI